MLKIDDHVFLLFPQNYGAALSHARSKAGRLYSLEILPHTDPFFMTNIRQLVVTG